MIKGALCFTLAFTLIGSFVFGQSINDARRAIEVEQFEKAKSILKGLTSNPTISAESYYYLGDVYLKTNELDSAKANFDLGVQANPKFALNYAGLGKLEYLNNQAAASKADFDKAISLAEKKDYRPYVEVAKGLTLDGDKTNEQSVQLAIATLEQAKKANSKSPEVYATLGDVYLMKKDANNAVLNYNKALEVDKDYLRAYIGQAQIYKGAQNYQAALAPLEKAIAIDPNYAPAYGLLAELYYSSGQSAKAIDTYKNKYLALTDVSCNSQTRYATFLFTGKDYKAANQEISSLLKTCPVKPVMYRLLGYSAFEIGDFKQALDAMNTFFAKQNPQNVITSDYEYMAKILSANKQDSAAIGYLNKAVTKDPSKTELYPLIGKMNFTNKNYAASAQSYEKYFEVPGVKKDPVNYLYYGLALMRIGQFVKADSAFSVVNQLSPTYIPGYIYRGEVSVNLDKDNKQGLAKPYFEKAIELGEVDKEKNARYLIEAYKYMADYSYSVQNDVNATKDYFKKVLELDPNDQQANDALKAIEAGTKKKNK
ncbi:Tetratricopeptide repeat-containing protein [Solitalea koreensis]|uniref:Tetratricopeptide repeat-containing protein n=2 Tax=Solitalea koreensis TaxID=543615 RepID=A0A521C5X6_9SPHI|nr:Tetratricopeptide repeat-containing protein [Solitalea koreensis]